MKEINLVKNINNVDYTTNVITTFNQLKNKFSYTLRISMILDVVKLCLEKKEFDIIDERLCENGSFESFLIDQYINWRDNKDIDFSKIYNKLKEVYSFSNSEKLLLETINIDEKLWAFFLALSKDSI